MSEAVTVPPDLVDAVEDNPEAVAGLLARLDLVNDLLDALAVAGSGLDDDMVEDLAERGTTLGMAADGLATDETVRLGETVGENGDDLAGALETLVRLQRDGTLDDLAAAGEVVSLLGAAVDDEMVESLADTGRSAGELAEAATDEDIQRGLEGMLEAVGEAERAEPDGVGTLGLLRATRDPEVRAGLGYLLALSRALGRRQAGE